MYLNFCFWYAFRENERGKDGKGKVKTLTCNSGCEVFTCRCYAKTVKLRVNIRVSKLLSEETENEVIPLFTRHATVKVINVVSVFYFGVL